MSQKTVLSVIGLRPLRIGAAEIWFRELSKQLEQFGWSNVLCFASEPPPNIAQYLSAPNVTLDVLPDSWSLSWRPTLEFFRLVRRYRPQIVHCHWTGFVSVYPWLARLNSVERFFFTDQLSRPEGYILRRAPLWKRAAVPIINYPINCVQCVSHYGYDCNIALGLLTPNRYAVIYNGVDTSRAAAGLPAAQAFRKKFAIPEHRSIVAQVSWIIPEKGIQDLIEAASLVLAQNRNVQFVVVGEGPYQAECQKRAAELGVSENLTWTGIIQDPLSEGVYSAADVVCQMSRWEEVFGQVITEAMASWKPVIGTRVGGIPELIKDGETGFVVERGDVRAMAEKIVYLLDNPEERTRMGSGGRQAVEEKFDHVKNVGKVLGLYGLRGLETVST